MRQMGKTPARAKDVPGFIVNRIARPFYNEALRILVMGTPLLRHRSHHETGGQFSYGSF